MKNSIIKIVVFAALLGAVVLILFISHPGKKHPVIEEESPYYIKIHDSIENEWSRNACWNKELYEGLQTYINVSKRMFDLSDNDVKKLQSWNNSNAVTYLFESIMSEWKQANCSEKKIKDYYTALADIKKADESLQSNSKLEEIEKTYTLYREVLAFSGSTWSCDPQYSSGAWQSDVEDYILKKNNKAEKLQSHSLYTNIRNISETRSLSLDARKKKAVDCKKDFYNTLWKEIDRAHQLSQSDSYVFCSEIESMMKENEDHMNCLKKVYSTLEDLEEPDNSISDVISSIKDSIEGRNNDFSEKMNELEQRMLLQDC